MLKASWTGLACFSTKQLTLLAVASVKASVHNNPSRIHWVCHNITFQDWSSKYEKKRKTTCAQFDKNPPSPMWVSGHHHSDLHSCHLKGSGDIQHKSNKSKSLVSKMVHLETSWTVGGSGIHHIWWLLGLDTSLPAAPEAMLKLRIPLAIFLFRSCKISTSGNCYRKRHRFSTGPAVTLAPFPLRFPYFDVKETTFHWRFEPPMDWKAGKVCFFLSRHHIEGS